MYEFILNNFQQHFGVIELSTVTSEDILAFMSTITDGAKILTSGFSWFFINFQPVTENEISTIKAIVAIFM